MDDLNTLLDADEDAGVVDTLKGMFKNKLFRL